MKFITSLIIILFVSVDVLAQQAKIEGYVSDDTGKRVTSVRIVITPHGQAGTTDSKGHFIIKLPEPIQPGQAARIRVERANWVVFNPMFGKCETQSVARNFEPLQVVIVPKPSLLALSPKRISEVIAKWADERSKQAQDINKLQSRVNNLENELDEYAFLQKYAEEYGFTLDKFIAAANQWAQSNDANDDEERALREYWQRNYAEAAKLANKSAQVAVDELLQSNKNTKAASLKVIRRYKLNGNSHYVNYKFGEALNAYNEIRKLVESGDLSKEKFAAELAEISYLIGLTKTRLGERLVGEDSRLFFEDAIVDFQRVMTFHTRESFPQDWAETQTTLGTTLLLLGEQLDGPERIKYLNDAVKVYNSALELRSRDRSLEGWALTQTGLGNALSLLGELVDGSESIKYLRDAVDVYNAVLEATADREQSLRLWAVTQINLGNALSKLGERIDGADGIKYMKDGVKALSSALAVRTREKSSDDWAAAYLNLGNAFVRLGLRENDAESTKYLNNAIKAYTFALEVFTYDRWPRDWSSTQRNLGKALSKLGERIDGADGIRYLNDSIKAYSAALKVITRKNSPVDWVAIQIDLASTLSTLGWRADKGERIEYLNDAIKTYRDVLEVKLREQSSERRAATYLGLGNALSKLGVQVDGAESIRHLNDAVIAYDFALKIVNREQSSRLWSFTQKNLGNTLSSLGERVEKTDSIRFLNDAIKAYRAALEFGIRGYSPYEWAETQNNLGNALLRLSGSVNEPESTKFRHGAIIAYRAALEVGTREQFPQLWIIIQKNLARTYFLLQDWSDAAKFYTQFLTVYPDDGEAHFRTVGLYHEKLFRFHDAFALNQQWVARNRGDVSAQAVFAEDHFTTGRFSECGQRINALLALEIPANTKTALRAIEIANLLALGQADQVPRKITVLLEEVYVQPPEFKVDWVFDGTRYFIGQNDKLLPYRAWLEQFFDALERTDRDAMLKALQEVRTRFRKKR